MSFARRCPGKKRELDHLESELQVGVNHFTLVLGTQLQASGRAASAPSCHTSLGPAGLILYVCEPSHGKDLHH